MTPGRFVISPGFFALYDIHNENYYIDPRLSMKYKLTNRSTLKAAVGLYSKTPLIDESYEPFGTKGLKPERSFHKVAGVEHFFTDDIFLDVQLYHKDFDDLVVRVDDEDPTQYANDGTGYAYGAEILLRHNMADRFFGWLSYSYSVSRRKDGAGEDERYFDYDIPHNLTAVASYKLNRNWTIGIRYKYASGTSRTDLLNTDTMYDADNDYYTPLYDGPINTERLKSYQQVDLRVDKHWVFDNWILSAYVDVRNVFQQEHVVAVGYNQDYTEEFEEMSLDSVIPLIFIGLKASF
jgi:outer membrane receptor for ferrienterochelin and colicin